MKKAIFLDRDGTVIVDKIYLNDPEQVEYLPGVFIALKKWTDAGFELVIVTNQSGVARGIVQEENIREIHKRISTRCLQEGIRVLAYYYAPYSVESNHHLRKPNPGMLELAAREHGIDLKLSWMIGDRMSDVEAGHRAGCKSILLLNPQTEDKNEGFDRAEFETDSLLKAADFTLSYL